MRQTSNKYQWLLVFFLIALLATACGPATSGDDADAETADPIETAENEDTVENEPTETEPPAASDTETDETTPFIDAEPVMPEVFPVDVDTADFTTTDSGLRFYDIAVGDGTGPENGDIVSVDYTMWLEEDMVFIDSTSGQPTDFILGSEQVFPGWNEGILSMNEGGKRQLIVPPELALGEEGFGDFIPPNSTLILEVELVAFRPSPKPSDVSSDDFETEESGLQYHDIEVGDGMTPAEGDSVTIEFAIWLQEDNIYVAGSEDQGGSFTFVVGSGQVFPGWEEGVQSMAAGGTRQLIVPPELGLGEQGVNGLVPPNSSLLLEMTLLSVSPAPKMTEVDESDFITTDSGLKYFDIEVGDGATPEPGQTVIVHYSGWLEDGTLFDSSVQRDAPIEFPLGQSAVIAGWDEGVATMQIGGKRQLVIPSDLAYGDSGSGLIPPGATLFFDVELLEIR